MNIEKSQRESLITLNEQVFAEYDAKLEEMSSRLKASEGLERECHDLREQLQEADDRHKGTEEEAQSLREALATAMRDAQSFSEDSFSGNGVGANGLHGKNAAETIENLNNRINELVAQAGERDEQLQEATQRAQEWEKLCNQSTVENS